MADGNGTGLALTGGVRLDGMGDVFRLADALARAEGFVPRHLVGKAPAIAAVILTGVELGIGPMEAMRGIHVVEGKPTMSAEMMLARARKAGVRTRWAETSDRVARLAVMVPGDAEWQTLSFSMEDAQRAGVAGKDNWRKYPAAMLRARCTSAALRAFCPEVLGASVYESTSGELTNGEPSEAPTVDRQTLREAPRLPAQPSPADALQSEVESIREALEAARVPADLEAARSRGKLISRRMTAEHRAALSAAAEAAEARLFSVDVPAEEVER
jgi:hypothetical protein